MSLPTSYLVMDEQALGSTPEVRYSVKDPCPGRIVFAEMYRKPPACDWSLAIFNTEAVFNPEAVFDAEAVFNPEGVFDVEAVLTPKRFRRSGQGCCTRLPWERGDLRGQPQRGCGSPRVGGGRDRFTESECSNRLTVSLFIRLANETKNCARICSVHIRPTQLGKDC